MITHSVTASEPSLPQEWLVPQWPVPANVRSVCTTRFGGVSVGGYGSLNLGNHVGDNAEAVQQNRRIFQSAMGVDTVFLNQVHGVDTLEITGDALDGVTADGACTSAANLACTVMVADCLPILVCVVANGRAVQVAALHAGWRGLAAGVIDEYFKQKVPIALVDEARSAIEIVAWMGPCIGPQAFEVGEDVRAAFGAACTDCFAPTAKGKSLADLAQRARRRLVSNGVSRVYGNDGTPSWCTYQNSSQFFSHRRDRVSGRQAASIWLV
jgi:YfiH family protein